MRGSSPALAERIVPLGGSVAAVGLQRARRVPRPNARPAFRATLASVDLEIVAQVEGTRSAPSATARPSSVPPPLPARAQAPRRLLDTPRGSDPERLDVIGRALADLPLFTTLASAASFALVTALRVLPSLGGFALVRETREEREEREERGARDSGEAGAGGLRVAYARGPRSFEVVRSRVDAGDPVIAAALARGAPVAVELGATLRPMPRHAIFGDPWTVFVAPAGRVVLELVDPLGAQELGRSAYVVLSAIARHLAEHAARLPAAACRTDRVFAPEQLGLFDAAD